LHRPVDASVMRPVTGVSPGHHALIKCVINAHGDRVGTSPAEQMSDIKHERGVTLAHMLSSQFPIYPDCGRMEYRLKFDPYRRVLPFTRSFEDSPIPGDTTIINKSGVNLPSVRHAHLAPGTVGVIGSVPTLFLTNVSRISSKPPLAAQTYGLRRGQVHCFFACRESRRAYGTGSQDSGLSQKLSTRVHGKVPYPIRMGCQLTRHSGIESNQIRCTCSEIISSFRLCRLRDSI
jgi:hypothetical protein